MCPIPQLKFNLNKNWIGFRRRKICPFWISKVILVYWSHVKKWSNYHAFLKTRLSILNNRSENKWKTYHGQVSTSPDRNELVIAYQTLSSMTYYISKTGYFFQGAHEIGLDKWMQCTSRASQSSLIRSKFL